MTTIDNKTQVINECDWLDSQLAVDIWRNKYQYENETFEKWLDRVSGSDNEVRQLIIDKKFLFGGRILANRGLQNEGRKISLSNCYVIEPPEDNLESIFACATKLARTFSYGGGCGIDLSKLSPRNAKINNAAHSTTGAVSFMDLYSLVTGLIGQNNRRGALMISLDCNHPDLEEYIEVKNDLERITKANISIRITNDFMNAVKNDLDWEMSYTRQETGEVISKIVNARDLFYKIAKSNWSMAEPGFLMWDRIKSWSLLSEDENFEYAGVNPCFTGDMKLLTTEGYKTFNELAGKSIKIINKDGQISESRVWNSGEKEVMSVKFEDGRIIKCTPNHIFLLNNGEQCEAKDLYHKRVMPLIYNDNMYDNLYVKLGFIQGDGQLNDLDKSVEYITVNIGAKDSEVLNLFSDDNFKFKNNRAICLYDYKDKLLELEFSHNTMFIRLLPETYDLWSLEQKKSFLKGCFSANGSVISSGRIAYKSICKDFIKQLQYTLLNDFGIHSYITTNKSKNNKFDNGTYRCKESYDLNIVRIKDIITFYEKINFIHSYKTEALKCVIIQRSPYVKSIKHLGIETVYDFTEPLTHWGVVDGIIVHNCAEEPLPSGGSCLLGSINVSEFVVNPFSEAVYFNYEDFRKTVDISVKALNDVLDEGLPLHPLQEQQDSVRDWRQIGLGIFGLSDMLIKMGIKYGSQTSSSLCNRIASIMIDQALASSSLLAKEFGCYPKYNRDAVLSSPFFIENASVDTKDIVMRYGLRNSQLLTCAPTGTLSTMLGISGGIEPIYNYGYKRKTESLHGEDVYYTVYTPIVKKFMDQFNLSDESMLPDFFTNAMLLDYKDRVAMQSVWQKHIDASISSTVNVPEDFTVDQVEDLYMLAWESGLKGLTLYRDNCSRSGILTSISEDSVKLEPNRVENLPWGTTLNSSDDLIGRKRKIVTGCGSVHVHCFFDKIDGTLYEVFLDHGSSGGCNSYMVGLSRILSGALRTGMSLDYAIDQLLSVPACPSYLVRRSTKCDTSRGICCPSAIAHAIKDMYNEVQEEFGDDVEDCSVSNITSSLQATIINNVCPECGCEAEMSEGCKTCHNCGYSKCGL